MLSLLGAAALSGGGGPAVGTGAGWGLGRLLVLSLIPLVPS